jgi:hypothetical protein
MPDNSNQPGLDFDKPPFDPHEEPPDDLGAWCSYALTEVEP